MTLASVQTSADSAPFLPYLGGALLFIGILAAFLFLSWFAGRYVARHVTRALDAGDRQVREFVEQVEQFTAEAAR